jgi:hypothetical protein
MTIIIHHLETTCPPQKIWGVLSDLTAVKFYNPTVSAAQVTGEKTSGVGAIRQCDLKPKGKITERVTIWEEGEALGLEIAESDWPITAMSWVTRITPSGGGSVIDQKLEYSMKYGHLGWLLNQIIMRRIIEKNVGVALQGMIRHAEKII